MNLQQQIDQICREQSLPGMGAAIYKGGNTEVAVAGFRKMGSRAPIEAGDKFIVGSCSKSVTATLMHDLAAEGKFSLDDTIGKLLPKWKLHESYKNVTLRELLVHGGGMPANVGDLMQGHAHDAAGVAARESRVKLLQEALQKPTSEAVRGTYHYSNVGYTLAASIAEEATGKSYEELVKSRIFEPLGMKTAGFGVPSSLHAAMPDQPWGHTAMNKLMKWFSMSAVKPVQLTNPNAYNPAGGIHASLEDWMKFQRHLMKQERVLKPGKAIDMPGGMKYTDNALIPLGEWMWHNGCDTTMSTQMAINPKTETAILLTSNDGRASTVERLEKFLLELMQGLTPAAKNTTAAAGHTVAQEPLISVIADHIMPLADKLRL